MSMTRTWVSFRHVKRLGHVTSALSACNECDVDVRVTADRGVYRGDDGYYDAALPRSRHISTDLELLSHTHFKHRCSSLQGHYTAHCQSTTKVGNCLVVCI